MLSSRRKCVLPCGKEPACLHVENVHLIGPSARRAQLEFGCPSRSKRGTGCSDQRRSITNMDGESAPDFYYVRDKSSRVAHHWDYLGNRPHRALCGHRYEPPIHYEGSARPRAVCRACQSLVPKYEALWWRQSALHLASEKAALEKAMRNLTSVVIGKEVGEEGRSTPQAIERTRPDNGPVTYYVQDSVSDIAHHWDYFGNAPTAALCGYEYQGVISYEGPDEPTALCVICALKFPQYEALWWRRTAERTERIRRKFQQRGDLTANKLRKLEAKYHVSGKTQITNEPREADKPRPSHPGKGIRPTVTTSSHRQGCR